MPEIPPPTDKPRVPPPDPPKPPVDQAAARAKFESQLKGADAVPVNPPRTRVEVPNPKGSPAYSAADLKAGPGANMQSERHGHTRNAEAKASADVKTAADDRGQKLTDKEAKVSGRQEGVQHHHHAHAKEVKETGLNPDVAGERERLTAVSSEKRGTDIGTIGHHADPAKNPEYTHHTIFEKMDQDEYTRTAKAMGEKGDNPKLPATEAGHRGLVDASGTGRWRVPHTADQTERRVAEFSHSGAVPPEKHQLNDRGEVIGSKAEGATAKMEAAEAPRKGTENPLTKVEIPGEKMQLGPEIAPGMRMTPGGAAGMLVDWGFVAELTGAAAGLDLEARAKHSDVFHMTSEQRQRLESERADKGQKAGFDRAVDAKADAEGVPKDVADQKVRDERAQQAKDLAADQAKNPGTMYIAPDTYTPPPKSWLDRIGDFLNNPLGRH